MRAFSRVVRNSPPPETVRWSGNDIVEVAGNVVPLEKYRAYIHSTITKLQELINTKVLCDISLPGIGINTTIAPDPDAGNNMPYHGPLSSGMSEWMDNPDSNRFTDAMVSQNKLGLAVKQSADGSPTFSGHAERIWDWLDTIEEAWKLLYCLYHITSGLPGRGTEESLLQWTNSTTGRRHLFTTDGSIQMTSNYHKGTALTGTYKTTTRLVLPQLSTIFLILLRIVRPFQLIVHLQFGSRPKPGKKPDLLSLTVLENYRTKIFVKNGRVWNSADQSEALHDWFTQCLGVPLGIRWYRQFAKALQRKWIKDLPNDAKAMLMAVADQQAGHSTPYAEGSYARPVGTSGGSESRIHAFCEISKLWQRKLGFNVE